MQITIGKLYFCWLAFMSAWECVCASVCIMVGGRWSCWWAWVILDWEWEEDVFLRWGWNGGAGKSQQPSFKLRRLSEDINRRLGHVLPLGHGLFNDLKHKRHESADWPSLWVRAVSMCISVYVCLCIEHVHICACVSMYWPQQQNTVCPEVLLLNSKAGTFLGPRAGKVPPRVADYIVYCSENKVKMTCVYKQCPGYEWDLFPKSVFKTHL